jgi:hypothetical protein
MSGMRRHESIFDQRQKQLFNCRICERGGDVVSLVRHLDGVTFAKAVQTLVGNLPPRRRSATPLPTGNSEAADDYEAAQHRKAAWIWANRKPAKGTIVEKYLREVRLYRGVIPPTLGFLPARNHYPAAMIAAFGLCDEIEPGLIVAPSVVDSVHFTLLALDGNKADVKVPKFVVGRPLGRPIVIAPPNDLLGLAITEGIEDALTAHAATGLGAWAAGSAPFMPSLADHVPDYIESITIYSHTDSTGEANALTLAQNLTKRGIKEVRIESEIKIVARSDAELLEYLKRHGHE